MKTPLLFAFIALCVPAPVWAADEPTDQTPTATPAAATAAAPAAVPASTSPSNPGGRRGGFGTAGRAGRPTPPPPVPIDSEGNFTFRFQTLAFNEGTDNGRTVFTPYWNDKAEKAKVDTTLLELLKQAQLDKKATDGSVIRFRVYSDDDGAAVVYPTYSAAQQRAIGSRDAPPKKMLLINVGDLRSGKVPNYKITLGPLPDGFVLSNPAYASMWAQFDLLYPPFIFEGGTVEDFVAAVKKLYGLDWSMLELTPEAAHVHVPKMRVGTPIGEAANVDGSSGWSRTTGPQGDGSTIYEVINLYNHLSEDNSALGKWKWGGDINSPSAITLALPMNYTAATAMKVKALSIAKVDPKDSPAFINGLRSAIESARRLSGTTDLNGQLAQQPDTRVLIAAGTPDYIEFVESFIEAYTKEQAAAPPKR